MEQSCIKGKKAAFLTLGCKVNSYESEAMQALLTAAGVQIVEFGEEADIYIINTCSVTNIADRKSRQMLHRARRQEPQALIAAAGCYVQTAEEEALGGLDVDVIIGNNQKKDIVPILENCLRGRKNQRLDIAKETEYEELQLSDMVSHTRAYVKIQDGCNQFCSYCIIPYARGRIRSRAPREVQEEVRRLAAAGYREIVLTGIHLSSYGLEQGFGSSFTGEEHPLLGLLAELNRIEGIERIRLGSLEPRIITGNFVKTLSRCEKLCPHFHLSLQSGSDTVLARMNRKYTTEDYLRGVELLRGQYEAPAITTDVIVGFPGESAEEFAQTLDFARKVGFSKIHVFPYSRRKGTAADRMDGQLTEKEKTARGEQLIVLERGLAKEYRSSFLGKIEQVLFEEGVTVDGISYQAGYNERYVRVYVPSAENLGNRILPVRLEEHLDGQEALLGRI